MQQPTIVGRPVFWTTAVVGVLGLLLAIVVATTASGADREPAEVLASGPAMSLSNGEHGILLVETDD